MSASRVAEVPSGAAASSSRCSAPFFALPLVLASWLAWWLDLGAGHDGQLRRAVSPPRPLGRAAARARCAASGCWCSSTAAPATRYCETKLYFMRQVRRAQGKDMDRVERLWLLTDAAQPRAELLARDRGHRASSARAGARRARFRRVNGGRPHLRGRSARQPDDALSARPGSVAHAQGPAAPAARCRASDDACIVLNFFAFRQLHPQLRVNTQALPVSLPAARARVLRAHQAARGVADRVHRGDRHVPRHAGHGAAARAARRHGRHRAGGRRRRGDQLPGRAERSTR